MIVFIDKNEKATNPKMVAAIKTVFKKAKLDKLEFGDVNIVLDNGDVLSIERKMAGDFLGSIGDGRVFRQVEKMSQNAKWSVIVLQGKLEFDDEDMTIADGRQTNWKGNSVRNAMLSIEFSGCPIIGIDDNPNTFVSIILDLIKFCSKPDVHHQKLGMRRIITFPPITVAEDIIAAFPNIGLKRARALMKYQADMNEGVQSLGQALCWIARFDRIAYQSRPEGWGNKIISNMRIHLGLGDNEYLTIEEVKDESKSKKK